MFILIDTDLGGLVPYYDHVNELDDKPVLALSDLDDITDYVPGGSFHVVDIYSELVLSSELESTGANSERWDDLILAKLGVRAYTEFLTEDSPIYAGAVPELDKIRRISVDGAFAETRASYFNEFGVNYIGRTKLNPRNIFVLDNKKGNPLHDPSKDPLLEALYASLPDDWWGSCGFVSSGNIDKLEAFFEAFPDVIPLAWTTGAFSKLKYLGLEYVSVGEPKNTPEYGIDVRNRSNRLSYELSLPPKTELEEGQGDTGFQYKI